MHHRLQWFPYLIRSIDNWPTISKCKSWSWTGPSSQRLNFYQASFCLSQEGARLISFLGWLRNPNYDLPGILLSQENPEYSQWHLCISKTQVQQWSCDMTWKNNTPENLQLAWSITREFASIVVTGQQEYLGEVVQGYSNYGTLVWFLVLTARITNMQTLAHSPEEGRNKAKSLFCENYLRLQELKKKHDPEKIFNKWFAITPSPLISTWLV